MTDPERISDPFAVVETLPKGAAVIYRHFGADDRHRVTAQLRELCLERGLQFLIGADVELAGLSGADGVHLPERMLDAAGEIIRKHAGLVITAAAHSQAALERCAEAGLDAAIVSPVFSSTSPSATMPLGLETFRKWVREAGLPVIALGGVTPDNAHELIGSGAAGLAAVSAFQKKNESESKELAWAMARLHARAFSPGWPAADFLAHLENPSDCVQTLSSQNALVGFAIARMSADQAEILTIVTDPEYRRHGYGQTLLSMIEEGARKQGAEIMFLEVAEINKAAIALYQKQGYKLNGRRKGYYKMEKDGRIGRIDALVYQKHLT